MTNTVLILGPTGRIGRHADQAFTAAGWSVRRFRRDQDLTHAARGADVIVNGWNPPYSQWQAQVPGLTDRVIAAARTSGATVIIPGNVYVFGPDMPALIGHDTPHRARHPLGLVRRRMEEAYREADIRTIVLRAGDFLDDHLSGNWFDTIIAKPAAKGRLSYPGATDIAHAWGWLPDLARAMVALAENRDTLPRFSDLGFAGHTLTGAELAAACGRVLGRPVAAKRMSWLPLHLARPFWSEARHILEIRYLWDVPHHLDGRALNRILPDLVQTPLASVLAHALQHDISPDQTRARSPVAV